MENRTEADEIVTRAARHGDVAAMLACDAYERLFASAGFVRSGRIDHLDEGDPEFVYVKFLP